MKNLIQFDQLVNMLQEAKTPGTIKDARNYVATGPAGLGRGGKDGEVAQVISVDDFKRKLEQNSVGDRAVDTGGWIVPFTYRAIITAFKYLLSKPAEASEFISLIQDYSQAKFLYKNQLQALTRLQEGAQTDRTAAAIAKIEKELPEQEADLKSLIPVVIEEVSRLISEIEAFLVAELPDEDVPEGKTKEEFVKESFDVEKHLKAYTQFIKAYSQNGEVDPLPLLVALFKTAKVESVQSKTVGDPQALAKDILQGITGNTLAKPMKFGRTSAAQAGDKSPVIKNTMKWLKKGKYDKARDLITPINSEIADMINDLIAGNISEADVIKALMSAA